MKFLRLSLVIRSFFCFCVVWLNRCGILIAISNPPMLNALQACVVGELSYIKISLSSFSLGSKPVFFFFYFKMCITYFYMHDYGQKRQVFCPLVRFLNCQNDQGWSRPHQGAQSSMGGGALRTIFCYFPRLGVAQPGLETVLIWDAGFVGGTLVCCTTMPIPAILLSKD